MEYSSMLMERHTWGNTCREIDTVMEFSNGRVAQRAKDNGNWIKEKGSDITDGQTERSTMESSRKIPSGGKVYKKKMA